MTTEVQSIDDVIDVARARALQATLAEPLTLGPGDPLPPFYHQIFFWDPHGPQGLGRDGHPKLGGTIPDMGLPRRMWAGGRLVFHAPLYVGHAATRRTFLEKADHKQGRSGSLAFITLRHEIWQDDTLTITEYQDLVYREDPGKAPKPEPPIAGTDEAAMERVAFNSTVLFRYSALTFNGHRIHYDETYARDVEGYDGLVVHGPLLAHLLMRQAQRQLGTLTKFSFKATNPLMHWELADLCWGGDGSAWVRAPDGRLCMTAKVQ